MRILILNMVMLWLAGCTAMMLGGGNSGGYEPPPDKCAEGEAGSGCKSDQILEFQPIDPKTGRS